MSFSDGPYDDKTAITIANTGIPVGNYRLPFGQGPAAGTFTISAGKVYFVPMVIGKGSEWNRSVVEVTTGGGSGKLLRTGLYNMEGGVPTSLLADFGTADANTVAVVETAIAQNIPAGFYFMAVVSDGTPALRIGTPSTQLLSFLLGTAQISTTSYIAAYRCATTGNALPASAGELTAQGSSAAINISLRKV